MLYVRELNDSHAERIYNKIYGYYETTLKEVFPYNSSKDDGDDDTKDDGVCSQSLFWQQISSNFFGY